VTPRPLIFISAVSKELTSARQLVANTLIFLGYQPVWQDIFGTEGGDLRKLLRQRIDQCKGVVQLIGQCYGAEPPAYDEKFGRVSYTQYEALYARQRGKKVWYLLIDENFPVETQEPEPDELRDLQTPYRRRVQADAHLFHSLASREALEASVLKLRDDLVRLRRGMKQWAAAVAIFLLLIAGAVFWLLRGQGEAKRELSETKTEMVAMTDEVKKMRQAIVNYSQVESQMRRTEDRKDPAALQDRVYVELSKEFGVDEKVLRENLPGMAEALRRAPNATAFERANAAYIIRDYVEAERLALQAADDAQKAALPARGDVFQALRLAGLAAQMQAKFARATTHFREAEQLTDQQQRPAEWAEVQQAIADLTLDQSGITDVPSRDILNAQQEPQPAPPTRPHTPPVWRAPVAHPPLPAKAPVAQPPRPANARQAIPAAPSPKTVPDG
jgi:hypothetical protein